ncbi:hypothetical protein BLNAU_20466 [Blattamonas nauphoetae]|uniref:UBX domain-containing protein n=1 Tax=Blattamonas nauphoetae TaxID=2049346 RepID=A0ABQ9WZ49_9EUKA|nr:hypothetical protein BLNAU_20466 [Blattamonas nauphoetae]
MSTRELDEALLNQFMQSITPSQKKERSSSSRRHKHQKSSSHRSEHRSSHRSRHHTTSDTEESSSSAHSSSEIKKRKRTSHSSRSHHKRRVHHKARHRSSSPSEPQEAIPFHAEDDVLDTTHFREQSMEHIMKARQGKYAQRTVTTQYNRTAAQTQVKPKAKLPWEKRDAAPEIIIVCEAVSTPRKPPLVPSLPLTRPPSSEPKPHISSQTLDQPISNISLDANIAYRHSIAQFQIFLNFLREISTSKQCNVATQQTVRKIKPALHPQITIANFSQILQASLSQSRPIGLFVHRTNECEDIFLKQVLCHETVRDILDKQYVFTMITLPTGTIPPKAAVKLIPGFYMMTYLKDTVYVHESVSITRETTINDFVLKLSQSALISERITSEYILSYHFTSPTSDRTRPLQQTKQTNTQQLAEERAIVAETNREYEESVMVDKAKEQSLLDEERRLQSALRAREEEEHRKEEKARALHSSLDAFFVDEPSADTPASQVTVIQLRLPNRPPLVRRFLISQTVQNALAVAQREDADLRAVKLQAISLPKTVLRSEQTFEEAGLVPRAALLINVLADEE